MSPNGRPRGGERAENAFLPAGGLHTLPRATLLTQPVTTCVRPFVSYAGCVEQVTWLRRKSHRSSAPPNEQGRNGARPHHSPGAVVPNVGPEVVGSPAPTPDESAGAARSAEALDATGPTELGSGSAEPGTGSAEPGTGSAEPGTGSPRQTGEPTGQAGEPRQTGEPRPGPRTQADGRTEASGRTGAGIGAAGRRGEQRVPGRDAPGLARHGRPAGRAGAPGRARARTGCLRLESVRNDRLPLGRVRYGCPRSGRTRSGRTRSARTRSARTRSARTRSARTRSCRR